MAETRAVEEASRVHTETKAAVRQGPGFISRVNGKLTRAYAAAPLPMGIGAGILTAQVNSRLIDPGFSWVGKQIKRATSGLTRGAAEKAAAGVKEETERNLLGGVLSGIAGLR